MQNSSLSIGFTNLDILRGGDDHDLLNLDRREALLSQIRRGDFDVVMAAPPCSTFSRALFSDLEYPMPLRDFFHPKGLPGLSPTEKKKVADNDLLVNFAIMAMHGAALAGRFGWLELPEDLGRCKHGVPASLWQLQPAKDLANFGYVRGALYQCEWSSANYKSRPEF